MESNRLEWCQTSILLEYVFLPSITIYETIPKLCSLVLWLRTSNPFSDSYLFLSGIQDILNHSPYRLQEMKINICRNSPHSLPIDT